MAKQASLRQQKFAIEYLRTGCLTYTKKTPFGALQKIKWSGRLRRPASRAGQANRLS